MSSFQSWAVFDYLVLACLLATGCARSPAAADGGALTEAMASEDSAGAAAAGKAPAKQSAGSKAAQVCVAINFGDSDCAVRDAKPLRLGESSIDDWVEELRHGPVDELLDHPEQALTILLAAIKDEKAASSVWHMLLFAPQMDEAKGRAKRDLSWTLPLYAAQLRSGGTFEKWHAISAIEKIGPAAWRDHPSLVDDLTAAAADEDVDSQLLRLINAIDLPDAQALQVLTAMHNAKRNEMMGPFDRAQILDEMMKRGPMALPKLLELSANSDGNQKFTPQRLTADWAAPLVEQMASGDVVRRRSAVRLSVSLVERLPDEDEALVRDALLEHCQDEDASVRGYSFSALARRPPLPADFAPRLIGSFADESNRYDAAQAVAKIGPICLPDLREAAISPNESVRLAAVWAIGSMKPLPLSEAPLLASMTEDENVSVRCYAIHALQHVEIVTPEVLAALTAALDDPQADSWAARALGEIGPRAAAALPRILAKIENAEMDQKVNLAIAVWRMDRSSPAVVPTLVEGVQDRQAVNEGYYLTSKIVNGEIIETRTPYTRPVACEAAKTLGEMGPAAAPAVPALMEAARSENRELANDAVRALGEIGPAASGAALQLGQRAQSERLDEWDRNTALDALRAIDPELARQVAPESVSPRTGVYQYSTTDAANHGSR